MTILRGARHSEPEIMDRPDLEDERHIAALRGLARINLWSRTAAPLFDAIASLARDENLTSLRVLDIATGGGDVAVGLWKKSQRAGLDLEIHACDLSPRAVAFACKNAQRQSARVDFFTLDALNDPLPDTYDVITCTLFLHHLQEEEATALLAKMQAAARRMIAVDDLRRNHLGTTLAVVGMQFLTRCDVVHTDGLRSVRAAFTIDEVTGLARQAGLGNYTIRSHWPFRFLLTSRKG